MLFDIMDPSTAISIALGVCFVLSEALPLIPQKYIQANSILGLVVSVVKALAAYAASA